VDKTEVALAELPPEAWRDTKLTLHLYAQIVGKIRLALREVVSFGVWPGDDNVPAPAPLSYTYPEPQGLKEEPLLPEQAFWADAGGSAVALLPYDQLRQADNPKQALLSFLESAYRVEHLTPTLSCGMLCVQS
jgi:hypothetical protein